MKIIDKEGRVFSKINILDLMVLLFICAFIPLAFFGYRIFSKYPTNTEEIYLREFEVPCFVEKEHPKIIEMIEIGDKAIDDNKNVIGEIVWKGKAEPSEYIVNMGNNVKQRTEDPFKQTLSLAIKARFEIKNGYAYFNNQLIGFGKNFNFKTNKYVIKLIPVDQRKKWVSVKVRFSGLSQETSKVINQGYLEKDLNGRIIGELTEILLSENTKVPVLDTQGNSFIVVNDPGRYDIVATLTLLCSQEEETLYFKGFPVKIGSQINLSTNRYNAFATVIDILDENVIK